MTLQVAHGGRKRRRFVLYQVSKSAKAAAVEVFRLLHDSMDLVRHVGPATDDGSQK